VPQYVCRCYEAKVSQHHDAGPGARRRPGRPGQPHRDGAESADSKAVCHQTRMLRLCGDRLGLLSLEAASVRIRLNEPRPLRPRPGPAPGPGLRLAGGTETRTAAGWCRAGVGRGSDCDSESTAAARTPSRVGGRRTRSHGLRRIESESDGTLGRRDSDSIIISIRRRLKRDSEFMSPRPAPARARDRGLNTSNA
jgi:hypothetical protein